MTRVPQHTTAVTVTAAIVVTAAVIATSIFAVDAITDQIRRNFKGSKYT